MDISLYPVIFADTRRSSFINTTSLCEGKISWQKNLADNDELTFYPRAILISGNLIFAYSNDFIAAFNTNGIKKWTRNIRPGSPVSIDNNLIYYRNPEAYDELSAVTFDNKTEDKKMWLLESDDACTPLYIEPLESSFLALCQCISPPEQGKSMFLYYKKEYTTENFTWVENIYGRTQIPPLHFTESDHFVVFAPGEIIIYNSAAKKNGDNIINHFQYPLKTIISASGDKDGVIYLFGENEDRLVLSAMDQTGKERWNWLGPPKSFSLKFKQPPIIGVNNSIHLIIGTRVITIREGQILNEYSTGNEQIDYCSAIADGSIFISADNWLYQIDSNGLERIKIQIDDKILTPPVIDSEGNVFISTSNKIIKIK